MRFHLLSTGAANARESSRAKFVRHAEQSRAELSQNPRASRTSMASPSRAGTCPPESILVCVRHAEARAGRQSRRVTRGEEGCARIISPFGFALAVIRDRDLTALAVWSVRHARHGGR